MRRFLFFLGVLLLALGLWFLRPRTGPGHATPAASIRDAGTAAQPSPGAARVLLANSTAGTSSEARITLADGLNAAGGDIHRDLLILQDIFIAWRTNYPQDGNPVGENNEITAALTGSNSLQLALIPANHPAINASGELCDRWGTPFVFHQLGGTRMEIRSAGPDRKLYTADDAVLTP